MLPAACFVIFAALLKTLLFRLNSRFVILVSSYELRVSSFTFLWVCCEPWRIVSHGSRTLLLAYLSIVVFSFLLFLFSAFLLVQGSVHCLGEVLLHRLVCLLFLFCILGSCMVLLYIVVQYRWLLHLQSF